MPTVLIEGDVPLPADREGQAIAVEHLDHVFALDDCDHLLSASSSTSLERHP